VVDISLSVDEGIVQAQRGRRRYGFEVGDDVSYDLFIYDREMAPRDKSEFDDWFSSEVEAEGPLDAYANPATTSPQLRQWFDRMSLEFPALNGPSSPPDIEDRLEQAGDYNFRPHSIYVSFGWSRAERAAELGPKLAVECGVGIFDPQEGDTGLPSVFLDPAHATKKRGLLQKLVERFGGNRS
jgi:hypothetical protein